VTFNDHEGSTKSYLYTRQHELKATEADFVPMADEITAVIPPSGTTTVTMHNGDAVQFRSVPDGYDPTDRERVVEYLLERQGRGEVVTGLLYVDESVRDMHELNGTIKTPLVDVPHEDLCPGAEELAKLLQRFR